MLLAQRCCLSEIPVGLQSPAMIGLPVKRHSIVARCLMLTAYKYSHYTVKSTDTQYKQVIHDWANWQDDGVKKDTMGLGKKNEWI